MGNESSKITLRSQIRSQTVHLVSLSNDDGSVTINFDLSKINMTREQEATVLKLFSQNPTAVVTEEEHLHAREKGQEGPASQYLSRHEFESIREFGVRLGTRGDLVALACDFCLHCVKLEALPINVRNLQDSPA